MHRRMNSPSIALFKRIVVSERMTEHDLLDFESTQKNGLLHCHFKIWFKYVMA